MTKQPLTQEEIDAEVQSVELTKVQYLDWKEIEGLWDSRSRYSAEQKINALTHFIITGSYQKSADMTGIPAHTIRGWATRTPWWQEAMDKIRKHQNNELDARISLLFSKAMDEIDDRIENGDFVIDRKTGQKHRVPVAAKDLTSIVCYLYDKRALMRGDVTSITANTSPKKLLEELKKGFEQLSSNIQEKKIEESIPVEGVEYEKEAQ